MSEEKEETVLISSDGHEPEMLWNRMFARLPEGVFQLVIEGKRAPVGFSGLSIDDVIIQSCDKFG